MTRTQTSVGKWECSKNEFDLTRIEPLNNGRTTTPKRFFKKIKEKES